MFGQHFDLNEQTLSFVEEIGRRMPGGFFIYKAEQPEELLYANEACFSIFGCADLEEFRALTGFTFRGMVNPEDYAAITDSIQKQVGVGKDSMDYVEYRIVRKNGDVRWVDDYGHFTMTEKYGGVYYVFISDITDKHERAESDKAMRTAVIEALTQTYDSVWLITDVTTQRFELYRINEELVHFLPAQEASRFTRFSDAFALYSGLVQEEDRQAFLDAVTPEAIVENTSQKPIYSVLFRRVFETGSRYYRLEFAKLDLPGGKTGIVVGFKDVDEETREKQKINEALKERLALQDKLLEEQHLREQQNSMIVALSSDYRSVYYVDLDRDEAVCYLEDRRFPDAPNSGQSFPYLEDFTKFACEHVAEPYREGFLEFIRPDHIRDELLKHPIISYRFLETNSGQESYAMLKMAGVRHMEDRDDNRVHAIGVGFTDIDAEMRESMAKNQALASALTAAEEANKAKTAFLSNMSHEIRTPMNAIIGLDSLALRKEGLDPETREYLEKIGGSARHLLGLINDILDMSRIESGRMALRTEEFSFRDMLEQINSMARMQCADKGLRYECNMTGGVNDCYIGDDMKLKQVLINILSNAIKFTDAPGSIRLSVERTASFEDQSTLRISVKDTGIGMDKSFIPKLFDSFTQEDSSRSSKYGSTGLGMAITKNIVELMNGAISVESEKGVGTEFTVVITLKNCDHQGPKMSYVKPQDMRVLVVDDEEVAAEHARTVQDQEKKRAELKGRRILLAEDILINAEIVKEIVRMREAEIDHAENGRIALQMFEASEVGRYDAILMDVRMPEMDGLQAAAAIRALDRPDAKTIPIIAMTANAFDEDVQRSLQVGMNAHLSKPVEPERLYETLEELIREVETA